LSSSEYVAVTDSLHSDDEYGQAGASHYQASSSAPNSSKPFGTTANSLVDPSLPFAQSGAVPTGFSGPDDDKGYLPSSSKGYASGGDPFDDDEGPAAYSFSAPSSGPYARQRRSRWQGIKEDYLTDVDWTFGVNALLGRKSKFDGVPREIALNDPEGNRVKGFEGNAVATGKYGPITFLPKFLFGM
jgi:phospholipid-transporting ATPase